MINEVLLNDLRKITDEEKNILSGNNKIEKGLYMSRENNIVDAKKLLASGQLIQIRTHTRFIEFPEHTHNYIEVIYMCEGRTQHVINGENIILKEGELLFLNQTVKQKIYSAGENDIAVNFIILPEFFDYTLKMIESEDNLLRDFIIDCLKGKNDSPGYMHFKVADILPIQNLVENLIWSIHNKQPNRRGINQATMGLLFLQLMNHLDKMSTNESNEQQRFMIEVLSYIEEHYCDGQLSELAGQMNYDLHWLSKEIKKKFGRTYTELVQEKRLNKAAYLITHTNMSVLDIGMAVGYDNLSYFHRIFFKRFSMTPRKYKLNMSK